jgi:hypothetical protein
MVQKTQNWQMVSLANPALMAKTGWPDISGNYYRFFNRRNINHGKVGSNA